MGLSIRYTLPRGQTAPRAEVQWCTDQGWRHVLDWRWFWNNPSQDRTRIQFHFEDPAHAHWFILRWGGEITGEI